MLNRLKVRFVVGVLCVSCLGLTGTAAAQIQYVGLGDSIGEGVQSADANQWTQPFGYHNLIALRIGANFPLPLIQSGPLAFVGDTSMRSRIAPAIAGLNLAVSGADVTSLLNDRAVAATTSQIHSETELVLFPRSGSQIEVAEQLHPSMAGCWIGNNDALGAVTAFDHLDASQLTSVQDFYNNFVEIAVRLNAMNTKVVFGTIPDVSSIGFLLDRSDLVRLTGNDFGLPVGYRTTVITMLLLKLGLISPNILQDPNFVLDPTELSTISQRVLIFNQIIRMVAQYFGMGVADIHTRFDAFVAQPPTFYGIPVTAKFLGGLFSLDGVHPSDIGQALVANEFINAFNASYALNIPPLDMPLLNYLFATDPFVDLNGNGRVRGRFGSGLLETLSLIIGFSGDPENFVPSASPTVPTQSSPGTPAGPVITNEAGKRFLEQYLGLTGKDLTKASRQERLEAFRHLFGLERFQKKNR